MFEQRNPAITPQSFPQTQAPIVSNPLFWERLGSDAFGTEPLFFAFYYQQVSKTQPSIFCLSELFFHQPFRLSVAFVSWVCLELVSAVSSGKRAEETVMEIPQKVKHMVSETQGANDCN